MYVQILPEDAVTLATRCDDQQLLLEEIQAKGVELEAVETTGSQFISSAKVDIQYIYIVWKVKYVPIYLSLLS